MLRLALFGTLLGSMDAYAGEVPDLAVIGLHQPGLDLAQQQALASELAMMVDGTGLARGVVAAQVAGSIEGREQVLLEEGLLGPGRAKLKAGIDLYNQAQPEASISLLRDAVKQLEHAFPGVDQVDDLWQAHMYLGSAQQQLGDDGTEAFAAAVSLIPGRSPDAALFPPPVVEACDAARVAGEAGATSLEVRTTAGAPVVVDGVDRGVAPVKILGMLPGVHHVVVKGPDGARGYQRVTIEPSAPAVAVDVVIESPWVATPGGSRRERTDQMAAMYRSLGARASGVELFLLGGVDGDSLYLQLYHAPTNSFSRSLDVPYTDWATDEVITTMPLVVALIGKDGQLTATEPGAVPLDVGSNSALASLLLSPPKPAPLVGESRTTRPERAPSKKRSGRVVLGIVAGVAVAGLAGGGVYLATQGGGGSTTTTTPILESGTVIIDL